MRLCEHATYTLQLHYLQGETLALLKDVTLLGF